MAHEIQSCHLKREYRLRDWIYWQLLLALPIVTALIGIGKQTIGGLVFYLILFAGGVGLIMRSFCTHCPHYTRGQSTFSCLFFWRVPKIFPDRQGPLNIIDKLLLVMAAILIFGVPIFWLVESFALLVIYILAVAVFVATHIRTECSRCLFVDCPLNQLPPEHHEEARGAG